MVMMRRYWRARGRRESVWVVLKMVVVLVVLLLVLVDANRRVPRPGCRARTFSFIRDNRVRGWQKRR